MVKIVGSAKGYHRLMCFLAPGAVAANTDISLPSWAQGATKLVQAIKFVGVNQAVDEGGTATYTIVAKFQALTIASYDTLASGQIALKADGKSIKLGDATAAEDGLLLVLEYKSFVTYV